MAGRLSRSAADYQVIVLLGTVELLPSRECIWPQEIRS
jgi:hypothetical protein